MDNALIYCRVSTEEQAETGHSLETQEKFCRQFAQGNGYRVLTVYRDEGKSGTKIDRPALKELLSRAQEDTSIEAVIIQETDRLARNTKDHLTIRALLKTAGVRLISVAQPMLDDSPEGNMIDTIIASVNQFQSDVNSRKTKKGLQERFDMGWWPGMVAPGYINVTTPDDKKIIEPDPERWHLIRKALKMYLSGNYSAIEVSDILYEKGLRSRTGKRICNSIMTNIFRNPFYAGIMRWHDHEKAGRHKPMITVEEHERILGIIAGRNLNASRRRKHGFILNGCLFCGMCGGRYTAETHPSKKTAYYHCNFRGKRGQHRPHDNKGQNIAVTDLEDRVQEEFRKIEFSQDFIDLVIKTVKHLYDRQKANIEVQKKPLLNQKQVLERKRDVAEEKLLNGIISDADFGRIRSNIGQTLDQIQSQLYEIECQHNYDVDVIREVLNLTKNIYATYKKAPYELKRQFLGLFWEKFIVRDKKIVEAVPNRLIRELVENKAVMIRGEMLPLSKLIITLSDRGYMLSLREKVNLIKETQRRLGLLGKAA